LEDVGGKAAGAVFACTSRAPPNGLEFVASAPTPPKGVGALEEVGGKAEVVIFPNVDWD
jgi:hypothetical protein